MMKNHKGKQSAHGPVHPKLDSAAASHGVTKAKQAKARALLKLLRRYTTQCELNVGAPATNASHCNHAYLDFLIPAARD